MLVGSRQRTIQRMEISLEDLAVCYIPGYYFSTYTDSMLTVYNSLI